ncbi:hypothetical protein [Paenibacillus sp. PSB04]|uniref:hypothetical protein n=1 Tax=Paenibacillus sp. PSB04 TaxID=2866810 RepID=UPI0021F0BE3D|nr:hypothetical protein [Paenibacillus sp. PSB04]UYO06053.1 hypothetical protein K2F33_09250 [Paenibacillus sp. PSB04]
MIDPKRESMLIEQVLAGRKEVFAELVYIWNGAAEASFKIGSGTMGLHLYLPAI